MDPSSSPVPEEEKEDIATHRTESSSSPALDKEYILVTDIDNGSDVGSLKSIHSNDERFENEECGPYLGKIIKSADCGSISSFTDVHIPDIEPKLEKDGHEHDVSALLEEAISAQHDAIDGLSQITSSQYPRSPTGTEDTLCQMTSKRYSDLQMDSILLENYGNVGILDEKSGGCKSSQYDKVGCDEQDGDHKISKYEEIGVADAENCYEMAELGTQSDKGTSSSSGSVSPDECFKVPVDPKDACVLFHGMTYLGSATVNAPVSEIELKRTISIMRDHAAICIDVILAIGLTPNGLVRLVDPLSRTDIASYNCDKICFWGKGDDVNRERDCIAFNVSHGEEEMFHCHVFRCEEEDAAEKIIQAMAQALRRHRKSRQRNLPGANVSGLDPNNLTFKFDVTLDILEEDKQGTYAQAARDKSSFKLRENVQKKVVLLLEQVANRTLNIDRCFGLLLCPGRNVADSDMHLLDQVQIETKQYGRINLISGNFDPNWPEMKVLNQETPKDTRVFMTVAVDLVFSDLKEPVRIVKETKAKIFPSNEKFWNPTKPRIHEEYTLELQQRISDNGDKSYEVNSLVNSTELAKKKALSVSSENFLMSVRKKAKKSDSMNASEVYSDDEPVEIMGPDEEDDEPLISGSGEIDKECTAEELSSWADILSKWKDYQTRPKQLIHLVRKAVPDPLRGQVWQMLVDLAEEPELLNTYLCLIKKESQQEQVILWDVTRTFPAHEYFKHTGGEGQEALYKISKAYSVYDKDVGYCQGLSFLIAVLLLHMPEEQAFCLLVKIMYDYNHRNIFNNNFELLHQHFYVLERLMEDYLPELFNHFQLLNLEAHMFASQWFLTLFTAKFPLPLVYQIMDIILCEGCDVVFQISLSLLKNSKKDFLNLDFEGVLKYFRVNLPKKYIDENQCRQLINTAFNMKVSRKKLGRLEKEYEQMKEELALKEDPVERLQRETRRLMEENMRLNQENDMLAHEIVMTQVRMQEQLTEVEDKNNKLLIELDKKREHLTDAEEEIKRLKEEETNIKGLWRESVEKSDLEKGKRDGIIGGYKKICTELEERNEIFRTNLEKEVILIKHKVAQCPNCSSLLNGENIIEGSEMNASNPGGGLKVALSKLQEPDNEKEVRDLEAELIQTKLDLAEAQDRSDQLELKLQSFTVVTEKPWYKKMSMPTKK